MEYIDDIGYLVSETLKDAIERSHINGTSWEQDLEDSPGVFYIVEKKSQAFVLRICESENLLIDKPQILEKPQNFPSLKLDSSDTNHLALKSFSCDDFEIAKTIRSTLANKRYPLLEENIFNISDPSYNWWVKDTGDEFSLYFRLSQTNQLDHLIKIGPLGDSQVSQEKFLKMYHFFNQIFPVRNFSCANGCFQISSENKMLFSEFKEIFISGAPSFDFWMYLQKLEYNTVDAEQRKSLQEINYFLMEISHLRRFWLEVSENLL